LSGFGDSVPNSEILARQVQTREVIPLRTQADQGNRTQHVQRHLLLHASVAAQDYDFRLQLPFSNSQFPHRNRELKSARAGPAGIEVRNVSAQLFPHIAHRCSHTSRTESMIDANFRAARCVGHPRFEGLSGAMCGAPVQKTQGPSTRQEPSLGMTVNVCNRKKPGCGRRLRNLCRP
jgi:hypothetical protein